MPQCFNLLQAAYSFSPFSGVTNVSVQGPVSDICRSKFIDPGSFSFSSDPSVVSFSSDHPVASFFDDPENVSYEFGKMYLPCSKCLGCRIARSKDWSLRSMHEVSQHSDSCFLTLTYNDENLPSRGTLVYSHFQKFMKDLRNNFGSNIRFFMCGEYGKNRTRPHYHALLYGFNFDDLCLWKKSGSNSKLYRSETLEKLWPYGFSTVGDVSIKSSAYVARYVTKKHAVSSYPKHLKPEFANMSRRPGVGASWFDKFHSDLFPHDYAIFKGYRMKVPRYYNKLFKARWPEKYEEIRQARIEKARAFFASKDWNSFASSKFILEDSVSKLIRFYEQQQVG